MQINTYLYYKKETKNTVVYECTDEDDNPVIPTLYVRKSYLPTPRPERLTVSIVYEDE